MMGRHWKVVMAVSIAALFAVMGAPQNMLAGSGSPNDLAGITPASTAHQSVVSAPVASGPLTNIAPPSAGSHTGPVSNTIGYSIVGSPAPLPAQIQAMITLAPSSDMNPLLAEIQQPGSPMYDHFLTNQEVGQMFGPSPATIAMVQSYFESYGLTATVSPDGLSMSIHGPTADVTSAFHTSISMFQERYNSSGMWNPEFGPSSAKAGSSTYVPYYANTQPIFLPQSIANVVSGVVGLDQARATPDLALPAGLAPGNMSIAPVSPHATNPCSSFNYGTCMTDAQAFNDSYGNFTWIGTNATDPFCVNYNLCDMGDYQMIMPQTMPALVGAHALWNGSATIGNLPDTGQNITVAVVEAGCMSPWTLQNFSAQLWGNANQVTSRFTQFALSGLDYAGTYGAQTTLSECIENGTVNEWSGETSLDIEYIAAMAPSAHIDLVGVPYSTFDEFDQAYQFIASNLSTGLPCPSSFGSVATLVGIANDTGACSVTIDSNSYGTGEASIAFEGVPIYLTVENQLLNILSMEGITNFFATGDYSGGAAWGMVQADMPSVAPGAIAVGGGQLTAKAPNGLAFENTSYYVPMCEDWSAVGCEYNLTLNVTPAAGIDSFSFWAYNPYGSYGSMYSIFDGYEGGGHGASETLATPWWENGNDTFTAGVKIEPEISNAAAFNMTFYAPDGYGPAPYYGEGWSPLYGGTSFACPITAAEWALLEEQAQSAGKVSRFGDITALLFALHNAEEAGVSYASASMFEPMGLGYDGFTSANWDSYSWYLFNLSDVQGSGTNLPPWGFSVVNPAGPLWNFLGGLGIIMAPNVTAAVLGTTNSLPSVTNSHMSVVEIADGNEVPVTELNGGTTYEFAVVNSTSGALIPNVDIWAYSGGNNSGTYAGGATTLITSSGGTFKYTPEYASNGLNANYTEYAYFKAAVAPIGPDSQWAFNAFAVIPPRATGDLVLQVATPLGSVSSGTAEVDSFTLLDMSGYYTFGSIAQVLYNGLPAPGAVVTQTSVSWNATFSGITTIPPSEYAPGTLVGTWISDTGGEVVYFTNGFSAEYPGTIPAQVFKLVASYDGLNSTPVTVFVEPQFGLFEPHIAVNPSVTSVTGNLSFVNMKYLSWLNISTGGGPGQFENYSCTNSGGTYNTSFCNDQITGAGLESSLMSGMIPVSLSIPKTSSPLNPTVVNMSASGNNTLLDGATYAYMMTQPLWSYQLVFPGRVPAPSVSLTTNPSPPPAVVSGTVGLSYGASWNILSTNLNGAVGTLSEVWTGGGSVLLSGTQMVNNGTSDYVWNSSLAPAGYVSILFSVVTPGGVYANASLTFYVAKPMVTVSPSFLYVGEAVTFTAWSVGGNGISYNWNFGDNTTSTDPQPTHAYASAGNYDVSVLVGDSAGIAIVETGEVAVHAVGSPVISASRSTADAGESISFSLSQPANAPASPTFAWRFGDGGNSSLPMPGHTYANAGTFSVKVWENGTEGIGIFGETNVTVNPALSVSVDVSPAIPSTGQAFTITTTVTGGTGTDTISYTIPSSLGCPASPTGTQVSCNSPDAGQYSVVVQVSDATGASVVQVTSVTVTSQASTTSGSSAFGWQLALAIAFAAVAVLLGVLYLMERRKKGSALVNSPVNASPPASVPSTSSSAPPPSPPEPEYPPYPPIEPVKPAETH
jgi:subtilase family serine protease